MTLWLQETALVTDQENVCNPGVELAFSIKFISKTNYKTEELILKQFNVVLYCCHIQEDLHI